MEGYQNKSPLTYIAFYVYIFNVHVVLVAGMPSILDIISMYGIPATNRTS